ncbi:hypothetical protein [Gymnodinialimonas sp.]
MLEPGTADALIAALMLGGLIGAGALALWYVRRRMGRQDWADAMSLDGPRRIRFMRAHGIRLLIVLVLVFAWFALVGLVAIPFIEARTLPRG